ncbi:OPLAH [Mytilus edulis]|uniref:OPLAH n=1 Tax=Mytilus edulis TaxID=6550 RepID=A0A8S3SRB6_MYTED|nr:OPLAH [Mytilus edulis]
MSVSAGKFTFAIDRGGTFTDIWAKCPSGKVRVTKLLSVDPKNYPDAPREGIRRIIEQESKTKLPPGELIDSSVIEWIRMGTTVATNALLERKGERMALAITKGYKDLLHIGNQARPKIFDLEISSPDQLYEDVIEIEERVVFHQDICEIKKQCPTVTGSTGEKLEIWKQVNITKLKEDLKKLLQKGIKSLAVVLLHSYMFSDHEREVGQVAMEMGFTHVSTSSDVMPMVRVVPRGYTACADAYLTPCIKEYVAGFSSGFQNNVKDSKVLFMQSDGGFNGSRAILSGPAGGVVGYAMTTYEDHPVIGFDMGGSGTSTDVSRYAGEYEHVFETTTAGVTIQAPQLDINTVAAGGGSMLIFRAGMFVVGPESAGADPGPTCYMKGGPLTITDANLCLNRLLPDHFPKIFGKTQDQPLDTKTTMAAFDKLTKEVNAFLASQPGTVHQEPMSNQEVAMGFVRVANETMCRPIRALTQAKGHDTARHVLACFGGAGGQHACAIARSLGMTQVFVHRFAGILSAYGMALADVVHEQQEPCAKVYKNESFKHLEERISVLISKCNQELLTQGFSSNQIAHTVFLHMRYDRTDCALMVTSKPSPTSAFSHGDFLAAFQNRYDDNKVEKIKKITQCYFEGGFQDTHVYILSDLRAGHVIPGPAIIMNDTSTILVEPCCQAVITKHGNVKITIGTGTVQKVGTDLDAIQLSIFSHRFMSIAEQMGRVLQRTSISTNIKERLDFSCAMFGPDGGLVANAPHIPVHLGAMQETVQYQMRQLGDTMRPGDVILSNHPQAGGSHLPDLTVITPVFYKSEEKAVFFVASRGHHADIGGITPGSMPPHSKSIHEEGAVFKSFELVKNGVFQEKGLFETSYYHYTKRQYIRSFRKCCSCWRECVDITEVSRCHLQSLDTCSASQGCMNNITFGDDRFGHYETVAGGAGAGPTWNGRAGVHTHMTNTRITDPEILERRYPVILNRFHLNPDTGGRGRHHGGDGVIREYLWRKSLTLSILTERRVFQPYGLFGGEPGCRGENLMFYKDGRIVSLGSKTSVHCDAGDVFLLKTPGGGGFGAADPDEPEASDRAKRRKFNTEVEKESCPPLMLDVEAYSIIKEHKNLHEITQHSPCGSSNMLYLHSF